MKRRGPRPDGAPATGRSHGPAPEEGRKGGTARGMRRSRRGLPSDALTAAAIVATVALALLAAACSSGSGPSSAGSGRSPTAGRPAKSQAANSQALAFAHCMRSHGVPDYPDPNGSNMMPNGLPKVGPQRLGVTMSEFQADQRTCQHLLPNGGQATQSASQQLLSNGLKFARCVRSHGVLNWPDPTRSTSTAVALGAPPFMFQMGGLQGLDGRSFPPQVTSAMHECLHLTHLAGSQVPDWSG
jgi:hypothetical protein